MTALALLAISSPPLRFVYVDPKGYVRLYGAPKIRSLRRHARQPDLSPDGKRFVYWIDEESADVVGPLIEHDLTTGRERVLRRGNMRSPRYAADGRTMLFTETFENEWALLALDLETGKGRLVKKPWLGAGNARESEGDRVSSLSDPAPQADGTVAIHDSSRALRLDLDGRIVWSGELDLREADGGWTEPDLAAPAPGKPDRLLVARWTNDADQRIVGTDGSASGLWIYDAKTMKGRRITPPSVGAMRPCWSRDGSAILYSGGRAKGPKGIWSIRPDGSGARFLVPGDEPSAGLPSTL